MNTLFRIVEIAFIVWYLKNYGLLATIIILGFAFVMVLDYRVNYEE